MRQRLEFSDSIVGRYTVGSKPDTILCGDLYGGVSSFSSPIGYQTNLIVQGIGSYKFTDFVRVGLPLNLITFLISVFVIPMIWEF